MTGGAHVIVQTPEELRRIVASFQRRVQADPAFRQLMEAVCGHPGRLEPFTAQPRGLPGLGMAEFAALVELPSSTVRHYQRLGLITPYEVNGKFRFWIHNLIQVQSVKQWRDLGLSLEDIQAQRGRDRLGGQSVTFNTDTRRAAPGGLPGSLSALVTEKAVSFGLPGGGQAGPLRPLNSALNLLRETVWLPLEEQRVRPEPQRLFAARRDAAEDTGLPDTGRLLSEVQAARARLEERLAALQAQVKQARQLEAALLLAQRPGDRAAPPRTSEQP